MWLIVGLGNPDRQYENNRHNIGFMALDALYGAARCGDWRAKFKGQLCEGQIGGNRALLLKPQTYMNLSGASVAAAARFYKIAPANIIVVHDELDLPLGKIKTKIGGGAAGHNGLKSIDADLGDKNYRRVRMGIGHPGDRDRVSGYVLSDFRADEQDTLQTMLEATAKHFALLLAGKDADFMTKVAQ